jgi:hypothetical protein
MKISDLKANPRNPRTITKDRLAAMKLSIETYGDLSGIVWNRKTKRLIGAHQRAKVLPKDSKIVITSKFEKPTRCLTVAEGYVEISGERFHYREVDADEAWETEAMLAANGHSGEWDGGRLKVIAADFPKLNFQAVGFVPAKLVEFGIRTVQPMAPDRETSDEAYVNGEGAPSGTTQIPTGEGDGKKAFDGVNETTTPAGRRIVIIIDCPSDEIKTALREKLREEVEKTGAKFF